MSASKAAVRVERPERVGGQAEKRPPRPHVSKRFVPYLFITPAVIFEIFIHILPMLIGIAISLVGLTLFYIHYWTQAPFVGLQNYKIALNFSGAAGSALLHSFLITVGYTVLVVAGSWLLGIGRGSSAQRRVSRAQHIPHPVPDPIRAARLHCGHHLELYAPKGQRGDQCAPERSPRRQSTFLAGWHECILEHGDDSYLAYLAILFSLLVGWPANHTGRYVRGSEPRWCL